MPSAQSQTALTSIQGTRPRIAAALGGPPDPDPVDLLAAHADLDITPQQADATFAHLAEALTATGADGVWQQGVYQFSSNVSCAGATFAPIWTDATGDELLILCYKLDTDEVWDFTTTDLSFSNTYGTNDGGLPLNPNIGIIVSSGSMGS